MHVTNIVSDEMESMKILGPKIWNLILDEMKFIVNIRHFTIAINTSYEFGFLQRMVTRYGPIFLLHFNALSYSELTVTKMEKHCTKI